MVCFVFYLMKSFQEFSKVETKRNRSYVLSNENAPTTQLFIECLIIPGNRPIKISKYILRTSEIPIVISMKL